MTNILMCWELGGSLGHITGLKPIASELLRRGHNISLALRDLAHAHTVFGELDVTYWQAPTKLLKSTGDNSAPATYAQLLSNIGFGHFGHLTSLTAAWRSIFTATRPDLVLFEHSPTALLAARGFEFRRAVIGAGFWRPPTSPTLPALRPVAEGDHQGLIEKDEAAVLRNVARLLESRGQPPLENLADLYRQVDETFLCTFAEFDHFWARPDARYWGFWPEGCGERFSWPAGSGKRIFAYLKPFSALPALLQCLAAWRYPTVIYVDRLEPRLEQQFATANLQFHRRPLDMRQAAAECDLAILNAGHGTLAAMLLAGKPVFLAPLYLEQLLQARRVIEQGYGELANPADAASIEPQLRKMFTSGHYSDAAGRFAAKYAGYDAAHTITELKSRLEVILGR